MVADAGFVAPRERTTWVNNELIRRIGSALVLAPLAIITAYFGGWSFVVFWAIAAIGVLWEWTALVARAERRALLSTGIAVIVLAAALAGTERYVGALGVLAIGILSSVALAPADRRVWASGGVAYAGALCLSPILLRADPAFGLAATIFLFAVVWGTDIGAYFAGRLIGGPRLMPAVSPNKTWSGAIGGAVIAVAVGLLIARYAGVQMLLGVGIIGLVLSVVSQAGDLFESAMKRHFHVKDSGSLIPGHGGLMDRLDGFVVAVLTAAVLGVGRMGFEAAATGVLVW